MSWVKLDDGFYDNPKVLAVGLAAAGLYAAALSYAARKLTDGFVPDVAVWMLTSGDENGNELPKYLVNHGLWTIVPGGYQIHDFLDYNPPASKVKADRLAAKERMRSLRSENVRPNKPRSSGNVREKFVTPVPVPVSPEVSSPDVLPGIVEASVARSGGGVGEPPRAPARSKAKPKIPWPDDFELTPERAAYATRQGLDAAYEWGKFKAHALRDDVRHVNWDRGWEYWVRNAWEIANRRHG